MQDLHQSFSVIDIVVPNLVDELKKKNLNKKKVFWTNEYDGLKSHIIPAPMLHFIPKTQVDIQHKICPLEKDPIY